MQQPLIIAHRGASYLAPENTLSAFRKAKDLGADGVEMDVQETADGKLVIHHDYVIDFHTQLSGNIYDMMEGELRELDFGSWKNVDFFDEKIPTLPEALSVGGELNWMMVELKSNVYPDPNFVPMTVRDILDSGHRDKSILIAFQHDLLRQAKELDPELKTGALLYGSLEGVFVPPPVIWKDLGLTNGLDEENDLPEDDPDSPYWQLAGAQGLGAALTLACDPSALERENGPLLRWANSQLMMLQASFPGRDFWGILSNLAAQRDPAAYVRSMPFKPDYISCKYHTAFVRPQMVEELHALGVKVAFWTVDTRRVLRSLLPLGPDAIVTNRPDKIREWIWEEQHPETGE